MTSDDSVTSIRSSGIHSYSTVTYNWGPIDERITQYVNEYTAGHITPRLNELEGKFAEMDERLNSSLRTIGDTFAKHDSRLAVAENNVRKLRYVLYGTLTVLAGTLIVTGHLALRMAAL